MNAPEFTRFHHAPLLYQDQIRLLKLVPDGKDEEIRCQLHHFTIGRTPQYAAISYRWGTTATFYTIQIGSQSFTVRNSVWDLLCQLREDTALDYIWIDSICIDQQNDAEKSHQVALMGDIYSEAHQVLIWLGRGCTGIQIAFERLADWAMLSRPKAADCDLVCQSLPPILANEYWSRLWIIQEVALARSCVLLCGGQRAPWAHLAKFFRNCRAFMLTVHSWESVEGGDFFKTIDTINRIACVREIFTQTSKVYSRSLIGLLDDYRHCQCTDPRDKIFALLSIHNARLRFEGKTDMLRANYSIREGDLVLIYASHILDECPKLDPLSVFRFLVDLLGLGCTGQWFHEWITAIQLTRSNILKAQSGTSFRLNMGLNHHDGLSLIPVEAVEVGRIRKIPLVAAGSHMVSNLFGAFARYIDGVQQNDHLHPQGTDFASWRATDVNFKAAFRFRDDKNFVGAACEDAMPGDIICKIWKTASAGCIVLREGPAGEYRYIGTAIMPVVPIPRGLPQNLFRVHLDPVSAISVAMLQSQGRFDEDRRIRTVGIESRTPFDAQEVSLSWPKVQRGFARKSELEPYWQREWTVLKTNATPSLLRYASNREGKRTPTSSMSLRKTEWQRRR